MDELQDAELVLQRGGRERAGRRPSGPAASEAPRQPSQPAAPAHLLFVDAHEKEEGRIPPVDHLEVAVLHKVALGERGGGEEGARCGVRRAAPGAPRSPTPNHLPGPSPPRTCLSTRVRHLRTISASSARRSSVPMLLSVYFASRVWPCLFTSSTNLIVIVGVAAGGLDFSVFNQPATQGSGVSMLLQRPRLPWSVVLDRRELGGASPEKNSAGCCPFHFWCKPGPLPLPSSPAPIDSIDKMGSFSEPECNFYGVRLPAGQSGMHPSAAGQGCGGLRGPDQLSRLN